MNRQNLSQTLRSALDHDPFLRVMAEDFPNQAMFEALVRGDLESAIDRAQPDRLAIVAILLMMDPDVRETSVVGQRLARPDVAEVMGGLTGDDIARFVWRHSRRAPGELRRLRRLAAGLTANHERAIHPWCGTRPSSRLLYAQSLMRGAREAVRRLDEQAAAHPGVGAR